MKDYKKQTSANQQRKNRISSKTGVPNSFRPAWEGQCPLYKKCNGCQMQNLAYEEQLAWKESKVRKLLGKFCRVEAIHGMENPKYYRNKVQALFRLNQRKQIVSGIYQSSTRGLIPVDNCLLEDQECDRIIVTIRTLLKSFKLFPYDGRKGTGFLRHVLVRKGFATGEIMVVLVTAKPMFPSKKNFINALLQAHPQITTIVQNISDQPMELVLGEREQVLYGPGVIEDVLCGCRFQISSRSFYQVNPIQTEYLYTKAVELAGLTGEETVIDAYCGTGTIGIIASRKAKLVVGIELNRDAVEDAKKNAKRNQADHIRFYQGDAGAFMEQAAEEGQRADVVFLDPPRAGSSRKFLESLLVLSPKKLVYISCNPETQERDLRFLTQKGYEVKAVQPVDMFPHTNHVETVVLLGRKKSTEDMVYAYVDYEPEDDAYLHGMKGNATYREIKEWIKAEYGMSVSSLYVAQIKDKCGFEKRQNYNIGENKAHVPNCPPEKEKAILKAFKHFRMI